MQKKVLVIGLDGAEPRIVFEELQGQLPNLEKLMAAGVFGKLQSCMPPITIPAWAVMTSGRDPGELGIYGFRNRVKGTYSEGRVTSSASITNPRLWDVLGEQGKKSIVMGVPPTYPAYPIRDGAMVSCFLSPGVSENSTYPPDLGAILRETSYLFDASEYRTTNKEQLKQEVIHMTKTRFKTARDLLQSKNWDLFMMVEIGVDRAHHGFWKFFDPNHREYPGASKYSNFIPDYYKLIDREIGELLSMVDSQASVFVVSDHGAKRLDGMICINEWLIEKGYLTLQQSSSMPTNITPDMVDWSKTKAWASGGYYARIYLNIAGREPYGCVQQSEVLELIENLIHELSNIRDDQGNVLMVDVKRPENLYKACNGCPPDLMVFFGDLHWRVSGKVGFNSLHLRENDNGSDYANHSQHGIFIISGPASQDVQHTSLQLTDMYGLILGNI